MYIEKKRMVLLFIQIILIVLLNLGLIENTIESFGKLIILYSLVSFSSIVYIQKKILSPINVLFITFVLFSAGIPIAYGLNNSYYNFYITLFTDKLIINAAKYTLWSIEAFSFTLILMINSSRKKKKIWFSNNRAMKDNQTVILVSKVLFLLSSSIVLPLYLYVAYLSIRNGFSQETRAIVASNSVLNLARAFYVPSFFLLISYRDHSIFTKIAKNFFIATSILSLLSGNRTDGILWLITYLYYGKKRDTNNKLRDWHIIFGATILILIAVYIGQSRLSTDFNQESSLFMNVIGEMGFNFTTICFVMLYIPSTTGFKYGLTYLISIICMIPKSLDILHINSMLTSYIPIQWLFDINHIRFNSLLDFGVGFSLVGESFMNFSYCGIFVPSVYALIICKVFSGQWDENNNWEYYTQMMLFLVFMTFPRRAFNELLNNIEYSFIFLALVIILFYELKRRKTGN